MIYPECETKSLLKIDENLRLWPCAFVSTYTDEFLDTLDENWNSLQNKSLNEVLNHDAFTKHFNYEHWNDETKCSWICKKECSLPYLRNMDFGYKKKTKITKQKKKILDIGITSHCNAGCSGCVRTDKDTRKARQGLKLIHVPIINIKQCINEGIEHLFDLKTIKFCGDRGDPMMHPDIEELIEYVCDDDRLNLMISTNGSIRNPDFYKRIVNKNLKIEFSIDGLEDTNHIYRYGCEWDNIWNNLTSYCNAGGYAQWDFLVWSHNWHQIPKVKQICNNLGIERVEFKITNQGTHRQSDGTPIVKSVEDEQTLNIIYGLING